MKKKYFCAGKHCPGYPYPASERMHPYSCCTGDLDADNLSNEWRPVPVIDDRGREIWNVVDDSIDAPPVAICPRGKKFAEKICFNRQMLDPIWGAADEAKHGELEKKNEEAKRLLREISSLVKRIIHGEPACMSMLLNSTVLITNIDRYLEES